MPIFLQPGEATCDKSHMGKSDRKKTLLFLGGGGGFDGSKSCQIRETCFLFTEAIFMTTETSRLPADLVSEAEFFSGSVRTFF